MITWMQRHKKWLVITIWISTIAFVGAGFVGWGSYNYGKSGGAVAVVGDREISSDEFQREYSALYERYSQIFGKEFNQELAKQLKLQDLAYQTVIQKNLILSLADEIGLGVTDKEIAKELVGMSAFIKDGKFDKDTYLKVLAQNRTKAVDFEAAIKRDLLLKKIEMIFKVDPTLNEVKNLDMLLFAEDEIEVKILDSKDIKVISDDAKLKAYWETNKNNYMSAVSYVVETFKTPVSSKNYSDEEMKNYFDKNRDSFKALDGKLLSFEDAKKDIIKLKNIDDSKKDALKDYLKLKKGEISFSAKETIYDDKFTFSAEDAKEIRDAKNGDTLKPFMVDNYYLTVKVLQKVEPKPLSFEDAKASVKDDFIASEKQVLLKAKVEESLKDFKGQNIGFVNRSSIDKFKSLQANEATEFLQKLFASTNKKDAVYVGEKAVVYEIKKSRLSKYDEKRFDSVKNTLVSLQSNEFMLKMVDVLKNRYTIQSSLAESKDSN